MRQSERPTWSLLLAATACAIGACDGALSGGDALCGEMACGADEVCDPITSTCRPADERSLFCGKADLVVTEISWVPESPRPGDPVTFRAVIENQGSHATQAGVPHGVLFKIDEGLDSYFGCWGGGYRGPLPPGASVTVTADGGFHGATWLAIAGSHSVTAVVDDVNRMSESNEGNNTLRTTISVGSNGTSPADPDGGGPSPADPGSSAGSLLAPEQSPWNPPVGNPAGTVKPGYYFVDSSGGSDSNSGTSPSAAWRTLSKVKAASFKPGDVIHFKRGGTFSGGLLIDNSGTSGSPITFTTYGQGAAPIVSHSGSGSKAIEIAADWVVIEGLSVRDAHEVGVNIRSGAEHNLVRHLEVTGVGNGVEVRGNHNKIVQSYIHDLKMVVNTPGGTSDYGATAVVLFASYNEVAYNRIKNCIAPSYDFKVDGGAIEFYGHADNNLVHHNWAQHIDGFVETGAGSSGGSCRNNTLAYNVSIDSNNKVLDFHLGGSYVAPVENFRFENNTVIVNTSGTCYAVLLFEGARPGPNTVIFRNNIIYTRNTDAVANYDGFTHSHNLYYSENKGSSWSGGISLGASEKRGNPLFKNLAGLDLRLSAGSPAINAGTNLNYTEDLDGHQLPCGGAPDLGAFEQGCP